MAVMNVMVGVSANSKDTATKLSKNKRTRPIVLQKQVRTSKRNLRTKRNAGLDDNIKSVNRTVELAQSPIEYGNIKQKLLFMTALGLTPKSTNKIMPPFVKLERLDTPKSSSKSISNTKYPVPIIPRFADADSTSASSMVTVEPSRLNKEEERGQLLPEYIELDDDELDLELLICPLDIPELFQDFFSKKSPSTTTTTNKNHNKQYSKSNNNNHHSLARKNNNNQRSVKQTTLDTYLVKQRNNVPEIPLIDLTQDDDNISCQDGSLEDIKRTLMSFGTLLKTVE